MPSPILLSLRPNARAGCFDLTCGSVSYLIEFRPSTNVALGDLLRRLPSVLVGGPDPSGKLRPDELLAAVGTRLWQALLPDSAPDEQRVALAGMLRSGTQPVLLALPTAGRTRAPLLRSPVTPVGQHHTEPYETPLGKPIFNQ